jgi:hypothetical protein
VFKAGARECVDRSKTAEPDLGDDDPAQHGYAEQTGARSAGHGGGHCGLGGPLGQPIDGPLVVRAGGEDLDRADAGRTKTRLVLTGARTRPKPATAVIDVHERPGPAQVQRPRPSHQDGPAASIASRSL